MSYVSGKVIAVDCRDFCTMMPWIFNNRESSWTVNGTKGAIRRQEYGAMNSMCLISNCRKDSGHVFENLIKRGKKSYVN